MIKNKLILTKSMKKNLFNLPTPSSITYSWNFGSMLAIMMSIQVLTGLMLSIHFIPHPAYAFQTYMLMPKNIWMGFMMKYFHSTGVTLIFVLTLIHIFRNMNNQSFKILNMWYSGMSILLLLMMTAFLGYVLPWGQMSLWGATVICNMFSSIPIIGEKIVKWLWGNFSVSEPTLNRFFSLHFIIPLFIMVTIMIHMMILHIKGSSNSMNSNPKKDKISFKKKFYFKDLNSLVLLFLILNLISMSSPTILIDPENFNPANPLITPIHIMPEWYFLFAYAMLRSIPNKMGGIVILVLSIMILFFYPNMKSHNISKFNPVSKFKNMTKMSTFLILTFMGSKPIETPFFISSLIFTMIYFLVFTS